jgi:hypothetical protein
MQIGDDPFYVAEIRHLIWGRRACCFRTGDDGVSRKNATNLNEKFLESIMRRGRIRVFFSVSPPPSKILDVVDTCKHDACLVNEDAFISSALEGGAVFCPRAGGGISIVAQNIALCRLSRAVFVAISATRVRRSALDLLNARPGVQIEICPFALFSRVFRPGGEPACAETCRQNRIFASRRA